MGALSTPLPARLGPGPDLINKPQFDPIRQRSTKCQSWMTARALPRVAGFTSLLRDLWGASGLERSVPFHVSPSGVAKGRCGAPSRRPAGLVSFGSAGMRDCATPNPTRLPPEPTIPSRNGPISSRSEPWVMKTAKSSKIIRANERKVKLKAKHRRHRVRAAG